MKKIYYVVEKLTEGNQFVEQLTGWKRVNLYIVDGDEVAEIGEFECDNALSSEDEAQKYVNNEIPQYGGDFTLMEL